MLASLLFSAALTIGQADSAKTKPPDATLGAPQTLVEPAAGRYCAYDAGNRSFAGRFLGAYVEGFRPQESNGDNGDEPARRALPAPLNSPPFPMSEWQGFPLIGVPKNDTVCPLMKAIYGGPHGDRIKDSGIKAYGWLNGSYNFSTSINSNTPSSY